MTRFFTSSAAETVDLGRSFAASLRPGDVVAISGDLGTGKTQFVVGVCSGLGVTAHVASPTFTLINEYPTPFGAVAHIDMYRIRARRELREIGVEEYFNERTISLIEWAEGIIDLLPRRSIVVRLAFAGGENEREILISQPGEDA